MDLNRRRILAGLSGLAACSASSVSFAQQTVQLGPNTVTSISDGHLVLPGELFFEDLPEAELKEILAEHGLNAAQLEPPCNLTLLQQAGRTILFDAGAGPGFMSTAGRMPDSLDALGIAPGEITDVVITHAHPDHLWGILDDFDDPVFPDATVMVGQAEWDYWTDPATVDSIGEARASFAVGAARRLAAVADQVRFIRGGEEILPGVLAHDTPGHTPGHMSFEVRDGTGAVMIGGDAIGNAHVAFARPDWGSGADQDRDLGAETRVRLLDQLAADQMILMGFHLPNGGLGRVARNGDSYRFVPVDA